MCPQVANNSGSSCGSEGVSACTTEDVTISSFSRRALLVTFSLNTYNMGSASSIVSVLNNYLSSGSFTSDLTRAGSVSATSSIVISSDVVTNSPQPTVAVQSTPTDSTGAGGGSGSMVIIIAAACAAVAVIGLCVGICYCYCNKSDSDASKAINTNCKAVGVIPPPHSSTSSNPEAETNPIQHRGLTSNEILEQTFVKQDSCPSPLASQIVFLEHGSRGNSPACDTSSTSFQL